MQCVQQGAQVELADLCSAHHSLSHESISGRMLLPELPDCKSDDSVLVMHSLVRLDMLGQKKSIGVA